MDQSQTQSGGRHDLRSAPPQAANPAPATRQRLPMPPLTLAVLAFCLLVPLLSSVISVAGLWAQHDAMTLRDGVAGSLVNDLGTWQALAVLTLGVVAIVPVLAACAHWFAMGWLGVRLAARASGAAAYVAASALVGALVAAPILGLIVAFGCIAGDVPDDVANPETGLISILTIVAILCAAALTGALLGGAQAWVVWRSRQRA